MGFSYLAARFINLPLLISILALSRGLVYGIASIVEKARGAKAAGATTLICPEENARELKVCSKMFV
jgi:hypothetical protein